MKSIFAAAALLIISAAHLPSAQAQGEVMFSYQGRVKVQGQPFSGSGQFKFAIVNTDGNTTLWSNDGTGTTGNEPAAHLVLPVTDGIFNAMIGDPAAGMQSINSVIFQSTTPLKLRVWFNDGTRGFQQLNPDHTLVNLSLTTLETGTDDFTIYVDGTTGNDANNGLSSSKAKKTIQAAVDTLPERINANVTIEIADGVYREHVKAYGMTVIPGKKLTFLGDETWEPSLGGDPAVRITASDDDVTTGIRPYSFSALQCSGIILKGLYFNYGSQGGAKLENGVYDMYQCKGSYTGGIGLQATQAQCEFTSCSATYNVLHGFGANTSSRSRFHGCYGEYNNYSGASIIGHSIGQFFADGSFSYNGIVGIHVVSFCDTAFFIPFTGSVNNNKGYGISVGWNSFFARNSQGTISGNTSGQYQTIANGFTLP